MKKNKIFKALTFIAIAVMLLAMFALPICAEDTTSTIPQISFLNPDFNIKDLVEYLCWAIEIVILIGGVVFGLVEIWKGSQNEEPNKKSHGLKIIGITIAIVIILGGVFSMVFIF